MYPAPIAQLIEEFAKMPGIGRKSAVRLAFYVMSLSEDRTNNLTKAISEVKTEITMCKVCQNFTHENPCPICSSVKRTSSVICVVENSKDVIAMEKTREFHGKYHVLHGCLSPIDGIAPEDIKIRELIERLSDDSLEEIIMATSPTVEGEATAMYLARLIAPFDIKTTRIAHGIPMGGDLEYADEMTLTMALEGRREIISNL